MDVTCDVAVRFTRASDSMTRDCMDVKWAIENMKHGCMDDDMAIGGKIWARHVAYGLTVQVTGLYMPLTG
jgi:hypothetical protein